MSLYYTKAQLRVLQFILQYRQEHSISPTYGEIAAATGTTKNTIYEHLNQLERKKVIARDKLRQRSITVLIPPEEQARVSGLTEPGEIHGIPGAV